MKGGGVAPPGPPRRYPHYLTRMPRGLNRQQQSVHTAVCTTGHRQRREAPACTHPHAPLLFSIATTQSLYGLTSGHTHLAPPHPHPSHLPHWSAALVEALASVPVVRPPTRHPASA